MRLLFIVSCALLILLLACGSSATSSPQVTMVPSPTSTPVSQSSGPEDSTGQDSRVTVPPAMIAPCEGNSGGGIGNCAPEFAGTQEWINSSPLTMESLRGQVVLIDFWTYTCVNCIRTLPYLREWHDRYSDEGLVIVGVHTPEFEFEKIYENVVDATVNEGVVWPVVQDNEFSVWRSYSNRYWPAKYLIDQSGEIRFTHFGEGKYGETEEWIRRLLLEAGSVSDMSLPLPEDQGRDSTFLQEADDVTRELFAGWKFTVMQRRGGFGQGEEYLKAAFESFDSEEQAGVTADFEAPDTLERNLIYFHGPWAIGPERARHAEETNHFDHYLELMYSARSVNAVLTSESGEPYRVRVTVNGEYLTDENKGADVKIDEQGVSYLEVTYPQLYKIVEHPTWEGGQVLRLASMSDDFGLFSFTFGVYEDGY